MYKLLARGAALVAFLVIAVPGIVVLFGGRAEEHTDGGSADESGVMIRVYLQAEERVTTMPLETYLKGVLGAEMPAAFEAEALKAQAVAARTYAVRQMRAYGGSGAEEEPTADVSTNFKKDQAWLDKKELQKRWGEKYALYWTKISDAVEATRGEIAVYDGAPIRAVFHSTSGPRTASAEEVWGGDFPYLQSVECRWDQESPRYREEKTFTLAELGMALGAAAIPAAAQAGSRAAAEVTELTASGRVRSVEIGGGVFSGQEIRSLLDLRSDCFVIHSGKAGVTFETYGYGHGVGMCQYGANGMAKEGRTYREILAYYYQGIAFSTLDALQSKS